MNSESQLKPGPAITSLLRLMVLAPVGDQFENNNSSSKSFEKKPQPLPQASPFPSFLEALTGSRPSEDIESFAGYTSHPFLNLRAKYYAANVGLWCDELPPGSKNSETNGTVLSTKLPSPSEVSDSPSLSDWSSQMLSDEAREVRAVIGGVVLLLSQSHIPTLDQTSDPSPQRLLHSLVPYVETVSTFRDAVEDETGRDIAAVVLLQDMGNMASSADGRTAQNHQVLERLEDVCLSDYGIMGWDFVSLKATPLHGPKQPSAEHNADVDAENTSQERNTYGEKVGMPRVLEVLEGVNWLADTSEGDDIDDDEELMNMLAPEDDFLDEDKVRNKSGNDLVPGAESNITLSGHFGENVDPVTLQSHEFQREIMGLRFALGQRKQGLGQESDDADEDRFLDTTEIPRLPKKFTVGNEEDIQIDQLAGLMDRVVAIREAGAEMSKAEREKFARREISRIMKDMG